MNSSTQRPLPFALVVDDDVLLRMDAAGILEDAGFQTLEAEHCEAALSVLQQHHLAITLLFTDVQMPGLHNGFALAREVAREWPHIAIVVASGLLRPEPDDLPEGARFIAKPFSAKVVRHHLKEVMPEARQPQPLKG